MRVQQPTFCLGKLLVDRWLFLFHRLHLTVRVFEGQTHHSVIPYFLTGLNEVYG